MSFCQASGASITAKERDSSIKRLQRSISGGLCEWLAPEKKENVFTAAVDCSTLKLAGRLNQLGFGLKARLANMFDVCFVVLSRLSVWRLPRVAAMFVLLPLVFMVCR